MAVGSTPAAQLKTVSLPTSKEDRHAEISVNCWLNSNCRSSPNVRVW